MGIFSLNLLFLKITNSFRNLNYFVDPETMSPLYVRSKVCIAPFHVRSKVCFASIHVPSKVCKFASHMNGSIADLAPHMEGRDPCRLCSAYGAEMYQIIVKTASFANFLRAYVTNFEGE